MKKLLLILSMAAAVNTSFAQAKDEYIHLDSNIVHKDYMPVFKTAILNQVIAVTDSRNQPLMLICLPANGGHSPEPGVYTIGDGDKRTVKKGSQTAKFQFEPGFKSVEGIGKLTIEYKNELYWFTAEDVQIENSKTKEKHTLHFSFGMFIEKK